jgi:hypothetical protein
MVFASDTEQLHDAQHSLVFFSQGHLLVGSTFVSALFSFSHGLPHKGDKKMQISLESLQPVIGTLLVVGVVGFTVVGLPFKCEVVVSSGLCVVMAGFMVVVAGALGVVGEAAFTVVA